MLRVHLAGLSYPLLCHHTAKVFVPMDHNFLVALEVAQSPSSAQTDHSTIVSKRWGGVASIQIDCVTAFGLDIAISLFHVLHS